MSLFKKAKFNPAAFVKLYDDYGERVYYYLLRRVQNVSEAEDLTSLVWEKVLAKIHTLKSKEEGGFLAWLFAITRNELNQYFRHQKKIILTELSDLVVDESKKPDDLMRERTAVELVQHCLNSLPKEQRETIELRYFAEIRSKEIAEILKISQKTVASNLSRGLKTLKQKLEKLQ